MGEVTFQWEDPQELAKELIKLDSDQRKEFFKEIKPPPMGVLMNNKEVQIDEDGSVTFIASPQEYHYNPLGSVHGGFAATMLDSCNSITANCALNKGQLTMTAEVKVNYLRGNAGKAYKELNFSPKYTFKGLIKDMIESDLLLAKKELRK